MLLASASTPGVILLIALYFIPTIVAVTRKVTNQASVAVINVFLGWTLIGWVVALAMACRTSTLVRDSVRKS
jgi:TRAP-type mannitol/chloroaromatic compound transport system permease small subunit